MPTPAELFLSQGGAGSHNLMSPSTWVSHEGETGQRTRLGALEGLGRTLGDCRGLGDNWGAKRGWGNWGLSGIMRKLGGLEGTGKTGENWEVWSTVGGAQGHGESLGTGVNWADWCWWGRLEEEGSLEGLGVLRWAKQHRVFWGDWDRSRRTVWGDRVQGHWTGRWQQGTIALGPWQG